MFISGFVCNRFSETELKSETEFKRSEAELKRAEAEREHSETDSELVLF